jgi:hypothetical protein
MLQGHGEAAVEGAALASVRPSRVRTVRWIVFGVIDA